VDRVDPPGSGVPEDSSIDPFLDACLDLLVPLGLQPTPPVAEIGLYHFLDYHHLAFGVLLYQVKG
jgi:hypothetical protein